MVSMVEEYFLIYVPQLRSAVFDSRLLGSCARLNASSARRFKVPQSNPTP
jgi:hypothetical protein